jgi:hypothetical protein
MFEAMSKAMFKAIAKPTRLVYPALRALAAISLSGSLAIAGIWPQAQAGGQDLAITASFTGQTQVAPDARIELRLNRVPKDAEGRLAIVINKIDVTNLFTSLETVLRYNPQFLPLPLGESEVNVYLVSSKDQWTDIARFTLNVSTEKAVEPDQKAPEPEKKQEVEEKKQDEAAKPQSGDEQKGGETKTDDAKPAENGPQPDAAQPDKPAKKRLGFEKLDFVPALAITVKSQPAQSNFPESSSPERPTFTDLNIQASFKNEMVRGPFSSQTQMDFVGASFQKEALRFGELGDQAPQIDLSSYLMQFQSGKLKYQTGHYSYGALRHLMNSFSSRGMMMSLPVGKRGDFSITAMNGSTIVGFGNFFGLDKRKHQLLSGTLGYEMLAKRPGGFRIEAGVLDGWLLPVTGFTEGSINDAQRSEGVAFRVIASDPSQRFKLDGGYTRSKFFNPADPLLNQDANVRDVPPISRNAFYLDASGDILKDVALTKEKKLNLTLGFKFELVDPLFRSLGASTQADKVSNEFSLVSAIGDVSAQFTHVRFNDNLARIPSILTSLTRADTLVIGVPLVSLFGNPQKPSPLFPRVGYNFNQTRSFGEAVPVNGGFEQDPASIPDQISTNQGLTADWQIQKWRLGYRLSHSLVNNRQLGSELADSVTLVNGVAVGVSPVASLDLNLDINVESANNIGARTIDRTLRLAPTINWRIGKKSTIASNFSTTLAKDDARTKRNSNIEFDVQWTHQFAFFENDRFRKMQGQFSIRYANRYARNINFLAPEIDLQKNAILNLGLSFNIF